MHTTCLSAKENAILCVLQVIWTGFEELKVLPISAYSLSNSFSHLSVIHLQVQWNYFALITKYIVITEYHFNSIM